MVKSKLILAAASLGVYSFTSNPAHSAVTTLGSNCVERWLGVNEVGSATAGVVYLANGISGGSYADAWSTIVVCPVASEQDLGTAADFKVTVYDAQPTSNYQCVAEAYDQFGVSKGVSNVANSSGQGLQTLDLVINVNPESSWAFSVSCKVPGNPSFLNAIRAF